MSGTTSGARLLTEALGVNNVDRIFGAAGESFPCRP